MKQQSTISNELNSFFITLFQCCLHTHTYIYNILYLRIVQLTICVDENGQLTTTTTTTAIMYVCMYVLFDEWTVVLFDGYEAVILLDSFQNDLIVN